MRIYYEVVGESFYRQNIQMLGDRNTKYDIPNAKLQQIAAGTVVYEYYFNNLYPQIFAEPNNPHDRNALRVDINGLTVGYMSRDENIECANILSHSKFIMTARIKGGRSKTVSSTNIILEGIRNVIRAYFDGEWQVSCPDRVIAWKPMEKQPEPYAG